MLDYTVTSGSIILYINYTDDSKTTYWYSGNIELSKETLQGPITLYYSSDPRITKQVNFMVFYDENCLIDEMKPLEGIFVLETSDELFSTEKNVFDTTTEICWLTESDVNSSDNFILVSNLNKNVKSD